MLAFTGFVIRVLLALAGGAALGLGVGMVVYAVGSTDTAAILSGALVALAGAGLIFGRRRQKQELAAVRSFAPTVADPWREAWDRARRLPKIRKRVDTARDACQLLLDQVEAHPADPSVTAFCEAMRKRVPETVQSHVDAQTGANAAEQGALAGKLAAILEHWARGAEEHRKLARQHNDASSETQARYTAMRVGGPT
ncbi:MAG: LPXTG cell wall anchor domain-containing protein [Pseudomonadota bacterium]